jgi:N-acetylglutamate synthase-like GNAT family acetyltransferase
MLIRLANDDDFSTILTVINDAAEAYRGVIPSDRWHDPYMPAEHLAREIADGVAFSVAEQDGQVAGVMGIQDRGDVVLIRHAYVSPSVQRSGIGRALLHHLEGFADKPVLIGTWAAASWAIEFYRRNGFELLPAAETERLLRKYWAIPERQIQTSVVLARSRGEAR